MHPHRSVLFTLFVCGWLGGPPAAAAPQLELPDRARPKQTPERSGDEELVLPDRPRPAVEPIVTPPETALEPATMAAQLIGSLVEMEPFDERASRIAAAQLIALGEDGLRAARAALTLDEAGALITAARVLATSPAPADAELLAERVDGTLPRQAVVPLVAALRATRPPFLDDDALVSLLDHGQVSVRSAIERELRGQLEALDALEQEEGPEVAADERRRFAAKLVAALESERADARIRALELLTESGAAPARDALLRCLDDSSPRVARAAVAELADLPVDEVADVLIERAFATDFLYRDQAYALLALCELESNNGRSLLAFEHVDLLLTNLRGSDPLAKGAAAVALAGIGFQGTSADETGWLDLEVPHALVAALSGREFHQDLGSVSDLARRRMVLLSGEDFGSDGPAWMAWWTEAARGFRSRRAALAVSEEQAERLEVRLEGALGEASKVSVVGPQVAHRIDADERYRIDSKGARELFRTFDELGLFGVERLPGRYGAGGMLRALELEVDGQVKRFAYLGETPPEWFLRAEDAVRAAVDAHRWQRFLPVAGESDAERATWDEESAWWAAQHTEHERDRRLFELVLTHMAEVSGAERERFVAELERLAERGDVVRTDDFPLLVEAVEREFLWNERAETLTRLALAAALGGAPPDASETVQPEPTTASDEASVATELDDRRLDRVRELFERVYDAFRDTARDGLRLVLDGAGPRLARELAFDVRAPLRALAPATLVSSADPEDEGIVRLLLEDASPAVEQAALEAIREARRGEFLGDVLVRARHGEGPVRAAALLAAGEIGGEAAMDEMIAALASGDEQVQRAAVLGLGALGDPEAAPILVSIVSRGPESPLEASAIDGLERMGARAWPDLVRLATTPEARGRRAACLCLARQGVARALHPMIELLTFEPDDEELARELALLTLVDFRDALDPASRWWDWAESAASDDALAWLRAAQERNGIVPTPWGSLEGEGTRAGAYSLWRSLASGDELLEERARRELALVLGADLPALPPRGAERDAWRNELLETIEARYPNQ